MRIDRNPSVPTGSQTLAYGPTLTDLLFNDPVNIGGNRVIWFVPLAGVLSLTTPAGQLTLRAGVQLYEAYATIDTSGWSEEQDDTDNGPVWNVELTGFLPGDSAAHRAQLSNLVRQRFIVEAEDNTGTRRRAGTLLESLTLRYRFTTGRSMGDRRGAELIFRGSLTQPPPILTS